MVGGNKKQKEGTERTNEETNERTAMQGEEVIRKNEKGGKNSTRNDGSTHKNIVNVRKY
jgi:hypothetical protein